MNADKWTIEQSQELYLLPHWGQNYVDINAQGNVIVRPYADAARGEVDLKRLIDHLRRRDIHLPLLIRFNGILENRVHHLFGCFSQSIKEYGYKGRYRGVYPIKVNQQRHVVDQLLSVGQQHGLGLEVGSKPELLAGLALLNDPRALMICNGYKDRAYLEMALHGKKLGRNTVIVIERLSELRELVEISDSWDVAPVIGLRARLATRGAGRWESSGGERSKFGLGARDMIAAVEFLKEHGKLDWLQLLHFHIGSQIPSINNIKKALREGTRLYIELHRLGAPLQILDVGGGLGVDYDGSRTNYDISINYSDQEYANDVVWTIEELCDEAGVPHPDIVSESGRALVAHHSVLVVDVMGSSLLADHSAPTKPEKGAHSVLRNLWESFESVSRKTYNEVFNDVNILKEEALTLFQHGVLSLKQRSHAEEIASATYTRLLRLLSRMDSDEVPEELENLKRNLSDTYFCNFSIFQSLPDCWAIRYLFPVLPIHRHLEKPTRHAVLADLTCDSDGKMDRFIGLRDVNDTLDLHALSPGEPYFLAFFLVGAYQEILGDAHNLFGDTAAVHVDVDADGTYRISHVVEGDRVSEMLAFVEYSKSDLMERVRLATEEALRDRRLTFEESATFLKRYEEGIESYTYLMESSRRELSAAPSAK